MNRNGKPRLYSYTRFSSPEQAAGDSERRQIQAAQRYAEEHRLILDEKLKLIDRGLSGFKGHHRKGHFGAFLELVKSGEVPRGSTLLVENLDRLSREDMMTQLKTLLFDLLDHDITIVTLSPRDSFTRETLNDGAIFRLIGYMQMGHAESKKKSERLKEAWSQKRKAASSGEMLTARAPAWLQIGVKKTATGRVLSRDVSLVPKAQETIQWIFQLKLEGFGKRAIERKLNTSACWVPKKRSDRQQSIGWRESYIDKILRTRAVLGEFQPFRLQNGKRVPDGEPIPGYFPQIVSPDVFNAVQKKFKENASLNKGNAGGKTATLRNVLRHLAVCGYCGGPMAFCDKGAMPRGGQYLVCDSARRGVKGCHPGSVRYPEVVATVLDNCSKLRPELILPDSEGQAAEVKRLRNRIDGLSAEGAGVEKQKKTLVANMASLSNPEFLEACEKQYAELQEKEVAITAATAQTEAELVQLERGRDSFERWQKNVIGLKGAIEKDADCRVRLNAHLKEFIDKIQIFGKGHEDDVERAEDVISSIPELARSPSVKSFRKYVSQRLLSDEGRFFRIHFKTGPARIARLYTAISPTTGEASTREPKVSYSGIQIAPPGSLAYRNEVRGKDRSSEGPDVTLLCRDFFDGRKPGFFPKASIAASVP